MKNIIAIALCATIPPVAAETVVIFPVPWDAQGAFQQELQVPDRGVVEVCEKLAQGARVHWRYEASAPVDFNVHYHQAEKVKMPVRKDRSARAEALLKAASSQEYCWMWSNKSDAPVRLSFHLQRR